MLMILSVLWRKCVNPQTSNIPLGQDNLPPPGPYRCRHCGTNRLFYDTVKPGNPNGNARRPYYVCVNDSCPNVRTHNREHHVRGWVTWDDNIGVAETNPLCRCSHYARKDRAGVRSQNAGKHFWTCSTGACGYTSWRRDGSEGWGPGF